MFGGNDSEPTAKKIKKSLFEVENHPYHPQVQFSLRFGKDMFIL